MNTQNQIKRTLSQPASIECVRGLLESEQPGHRTELAMRICEEFDFHDARGQAQSAGCLKALRELEGGGHFVLPAALTSSGGGSPRRLCEPVPEPVQVSREGA